MFEGEWLSLKKLLPILFAALILSGCSEEANSEETQKPISELDQSIEYSILENFSYRHEIPEDAIKLVDFDESTGKMKIIVYTYSFIDESSEEFKADTLDSIVNLLRDVKRQSEVKEVNLIVKTTFEDMNGDPFDGAVFTIDFNNRSLKSTNFNEVDPLQLSKKASFYFEAPGM